MSGALRDYLLSITAASLLLAVVLAATPKGTVHKIVGLIGGMVVVLVVISPIAKIDSSIISAEISRFALQSDTVYTGIEIGSRELLRQVITEKCETYILDKARGLGLELQVEIELQEDAEYPYPVRVTLRGSWSEQQRRMLSSQIAEELGVPTQQQEWLLM